eukprot:Em0022g597a
MEETILLPIVFNFRKPHYTHQNIETQYGVAKQMTKYCTSDGSQPTINAGPVVDVNGCIWIGDSGELHLFNFNLFLDVPKLVIAAFHHRFIDIIDHQQYILHSDMIQHLYYFLKPF